MNQELLISIYQMSVSSHEEENIAKVAYTVEEAARRGSQMLLLPELWSNGDVLGRAVQTASPLGQGIFAKMAQLAKTYQICMLGSNFSLMADGKVGNTAVFFGQDGNILGVYSKIHLFRLMDEHRYLTGGEQLTVVETSWGKAGLSICYDLRFPEVYRAYALAGVRIVFVPAAWPHPRLHHWQTLLRARAIENQFFVVACNRVGKNGALEFFGHSCVIDPSGETLMQAGENETLLTLTLSLDVIEQVRSEIPIFEDRNPTAYKL